MNYLVQGKYARTFNTVCCYPTNIHL